MLRVVMVHVGGCGCGWVVGGYGQEVVLGELIRELWDSDCWFMGEGGWSVVVAGIGWVCATSGDIWFFH